MWQIKWLRRMVRRNTPPIPEYKAALWKQRLSLAYMFLAWNAFGAVCYMVYTGRKDWAEYYGFKTEEEARMPPGLQWAKVLGFEKAKVIRYSGFQREGEYLYEKEEPSDGRQNEKEAVIN